MNAVAFPEPDITPLNKPHWDGLREGKLMFQRCKVCNNAWLPAREACPRCLSTDNVWEASSGKGKLVTWVVFHTAYHDAFKTKVPYATMVAEFEEGFRLLGNLASGGDIKSLRVGMPLQFVAEKEGDLALARFRPT